MSLKWENSQAIAKALKDKYEDTINIYDIDSQELTKMVISLDDWDDDADYDNELILTDILHAWINLCEYE